MFGRLLKLAGWLLAIVVVLAAAAGLWAVARWDRTFDAPLPDITASTDSSIIARGRYLAYGPGRCVECHASAEAMAAMDTGVLPPLAGGTEFALMVGTIRAPNITPDRILGIGRFSDGQLARTLRYGVRPDGRATVPLMELQNLSDDDLTALISFLRTQPKVQRRVPDHDFNLAGKVVMAFVMRPTGPAEKPPAHSPPESATVERGAYLAGAVATCAACHTRRNPLNGAYVGTRFAGGERFVIAADPESVFVSPNLTSSGTGLAAGWSEDQFVARFRVGPALPHSPMPWQAFGRMTETDVRALYRYLRTLPPDTTNPGPVRQPR